MVKCVDPDQWLHPGMCNLLSYAHTRYMCMPRSVDLAMSVVQSLTSWFNRVDIVDHDQYASANTSI